MEDHTLHQSLMRTPQHCTLQALIDGKVLCVHGGLSPDIRTLDQVRSDSSRAPVSSDRPRQLGAAGAECITGAGGTQLTRPVTCSTFSNMHAANQNPASARHACTAAAWMQARHVWAKHHAMHMLLPADSHNRPCV